MKTVQIKDIQKIVTKDFYRMYAKIYGEQEAKKKFKVKK